jgi:hypothetical protein
MFIKINRKEPNRSDNIFCIAKAIATPPIPKPATKEVILTFRLDKINNIATTQRANFIALVNKSIAAFSLDHLYMITFAAK